MTIDLHDITDYVAYWVLFWTVVNIILPPREIFEGGTPAWYNTTLKLVAYYGSLNLRQFSVKLYSAVNQAPPQEVQLNRALDKATDAVVEAKAIAADVTEKP